MRTLILALVLVASQEVFSCTHDMDCGFGNKCLNGNNGFGKGFCVKATSQAGWGQQQRAFEGCSSDIECGIGVTCVKRAGQFRGICVD